LLPLLIYFLLRKKRNIEAITYNDGCFYQGVDPEYYFVLRLGDGGINLKDMKPSEKVVENLNSSRPLNNAAEKTDFGKTDILALAENPTTTDPNYVMNNNFINKTMSFHEDGKEKVATESAAQEYKNLTKYNKVTSADYLHLEADDAHYDKRTFNKYVVDELMQSHNIIKLIFKRSLLEPAPLLALKLMLNITVTMGVNALLTSDASIEERAASSNRVIIKL
jgi:hypothetical protein